MYACDMAFNIGLQNIFAVCDVQHIGQIFPIMLAFAAYCCISQTTVVVILMLQVRFSCFVFFC